ncbi:MAG: prepilin-type N-terminal cleavage/methylation domain-containing protein [Kiritimatiellae bacterium]|nr:prepilin-type N-terminal cleavage/methylation domain-containing protein [Kiritimatiellia bacterium]
MKRFKDNTSNAFTLVEMLVVLGMISILMGVTFTGIGRARTAARVAKANSEVRSLMNAWLSYEASYDDWPVAVQGDVVEATEGNISELLGKNDSKTVFLNVQLINGAFRDPWGTPYRFRLLSDSGGDNKTTDYFGSAVTFPNRMRAAVAP